jgi:hypothetical protein
MKSPIHTSQLCILLCALTLSLCAWSMPDRSDSIVVDGKVIRVQAYVEIDTVARPKRWQFGWNFTGSDAPRSIKRKAPAWNGMEVFGRFPCAGAQVAGVRLENFTSGVPAAGWGGSWTRVVPRPGRRSWGFGLMLSGQFMEHASFSEITPDSLIGFLPHTSTSVFAVTRSQYDLGIETDTIPIGLMNSSAWSAMAAVVMRMELRRNMPLQLSFGLERWSQDRQVTHVREPALNQMPWVISLEEGRSWQPVMGMQLGWAWGRSKSRYQRQFQGSWSANAGFSWRPMEAEPISLRVGVLTSIGK